MNRYSFTPTTELAAWDDWLLELLRGGPRVQ